MKSLGIMKVHPNDVTTLVASTLNYAKLLNKLTNLVECKIQKTIPVSFLAISKCPQQNSRFTTEVVIQGV